MAISPPTRRALGDLPVNMFGTPPTTGILGKANAGLKRQIHEVDNPECGQSASRVRRSHGHWQTNTKEDLPLPQASHASKAQSLASYDTAIVLPPASDDAPMGRATERGEEFGDADSQNSYKDSMSSLIDFDPDETMASQQTAATEVTMPLPSRVRQHAETLRLRLRLAHFKVQTNQTDIPLSRLRLFTNDDEDQTTQPGSPIVEHPSLPKLLPAPVLLPTAFSARIISRPRIASSPPTSTGNSPSKAGGREVFRTPALPRHVAQITSQQVSSPSDEHLTSSAIRGKAAIGLLGLRQEK